MKSLVARTVVVAGGSALAVPLLAIPASAGGAEVFLDSAMALDRREGTITLPLHRGRHDGATVWYVVTESSNRDDAERRGVNHAEKLTNALGTAAVQAARRVRGALVFTGTVDFGPERVVVPGQAPDFFPPAVARGRRRRLQPPCDAGRAHGA